MKVMLKALAVLTLLVVLGAGAAVFLLVRGGSGLDNWIAQQVVSISNYYLVPRIEFRRFEFRAPGTLILHQATLTAPDGTRVVDAPTIQIDLARTPRMGQPLEIATITLIDPELNLVQDESGGFKGLVPFVRQQRIQEQDRAPSEVKLSNVMRLREFRLQNGSVLFRPASDDPPMELRGLSMDLDIEPANEEGESGAWYAVALQANRAPVFTLAIDGRFDLDNFVADFRRLTFETRLDDESYPTLAPQLQTLLRTYDARGDMKITASGLVPIRDFPSSRLMARMDLENFNIAMGEFTFPISSAQLGARLAEGVGELPIAVVNTLGGRITLENAWMDFTNESRPVKAEWRIEKIDLQQALRSRPTDRPPRIAGVLESHGSVGASSAAMRETLSGSGVVSIRDGRLVSIPLVTGVMSTFGVLDRLTGRADFSDQASMQFEFRPEHVFVNNLDIVTQVAAVRGRRDNVGTIGYDGALDLTVNAGPLERIQGMLGGIGRALGAITDQIASYRVRGTIGAPRVTVQPLRLGGGS